MTEDQQKLPSGWALPRVDQVGSVRLGRQKTPDKQSGRFPTKYIRLANLRGDGQIDVTDLSEMDFTPAERTVFELRDGDILLADSSGSAAQIGRAAIWRNQVPGCCYQNHLIRFRPHTTSPEYALALFRHFALSGRFADVARGIGIQHLGASRFAVMPFILPPLKEQERIATAVGARLSEIREADARLRSALGHLAEQTRETLAAAVAGELIDIPKQPADRPSGSQPAASKRRTPKRDQHGQGTLFVSDSSDHNAAPSAAALPAGWTWRRMDEVGEVTIGRQRSPKHQHGPHMRPYLRVANVYEDRIDASDILEMNFEPEEYATYALKYGDILLNEGQSPELVGRPAKYRDEIPGACFQNTLIRFRAGPLVDPDFALLVFRHNLHAGVFRDIARWSTNIAHLGLERFRMLQFPLPPVEQQTLIAAEARDRLETVSAQADAVRASLARLPEMERELLAAAMAGELTPRDPTDEPASALMSRLGPPPHDIPSDKTINDKNGEGAVTTKPKAASRRLTPTSDLATVLLEAGRPLPLPELFGQAGYDRDQPEHVELFYLVLRAELGRTIRQIGADTENAVLEVVDAAQ